MFITGAASGIGRAVARRFVAHGWFVGLYDVDAEAVTALHEDFGTYRSCAQPIDVTAPRAVQEAIDQFADRTGGRMDVLFNSAGVLTVGRFETIDLAVHHHVIDVNLTGILNCTHLAFPLLRSTTGARVVNMSSAAAAYGTPELATYSASKHAVRGLTEALHLEWAEHDIHVCDVMPPYVNTPMTRNAARARSMDAMGIDLTAEDVVRVVERAVLGPRRVHWPVGRSYRWLYRLIDWLPSAFYRRIMQLVSGFGGK